MNKRYGICDIAREVGMSPATVSLVLNGKWRKKVRPDIAINIQALAARHGYTGNPAARSLVLRRHFRVALCISQAFISRPVIGAFSYHALLAELAGRLGQQRYAMNVVTLNPKDCRRALHAASNENDALVFLGWTERDLRRMLRGWSAPVPVMALDCKASPALAASIVVDPGPGVVQAMEHFVGNGHRNIAFVRGETQSERFQIKMAIARKALQRRGIPWTSVAVINDPDLTPMARGYAAAERLLRTNPRPMAVFCSDTVCAMGMVHVLRGNGVQVPRDVEIIAYGDRPLADLCVPPLSCVQLPTVEMAEQGIGLLMEMMENKAPPRVMPCPARLLLRGTTRPAQQIPG